VNALLYLLLGLATFAALSALILVLARGEAD
jgi:hypothetical protein